MNYPPDDHHLNNEELAEESRAEPQANFVAGNNLAESNELNENYETEQPRADGTKAPPKIFFFILALLGFGTLLFGFISLANNIKSPFFTAPETQVTTTNNSTGESTLSAAEIVALKNTDTDGDGLSDYDETYTYKTSPYLADTDSDGYSDKQEIDSGHDPLCPTGRDCRALEQTADNNQNVITPLPGMEDLNTEPTPPNETATSTALTEEQKNQLKQLTPAEVRQLLLESGKMTADQLEQISDEQLMQIFLESLK
jgi:hypothetical protein